MKAFLTSIIFILAALQGNALVKISGKVLDSETGRPINAVSINITGQSKTTSTNDFGEFSINVETLPVKLAFSHISFQTKELLADSVKFTVFLTPANISLSEIRIVSQSPINLLNKAWAIANENLGYFYFAKAFYRQVTTVNDSATEIHELFYNLKWSTDRINGWRAQQSRYAQLDIFKDVSVTNQSYLAFLFSGYLFSFDNAKYPSTGSVKNIIWSK